MSALTLSAVLTLVGQQAQALDLWNAAAPFRFAKRQDFANGAGANQASQMFSDRRTVAAASVDSIDLSGALLNAFGESVALTKVKGLLLVASSENVPSLIVGGAASNAWVGPFGAATHTLTLRPGGILLLTAPDAAGYTVTAGTVDILAVENEHAEESATFDFVIWGA